MIASRLNPSCASVKRMIALRPRLSLLAMTTAVSGIASFFGFHTQSGAFFAFFVCAGGGAVVAMACSLVGAGVAAASSFDAGLILGAASDALLAFIGWVVGLDNEPLDTPGEGEPSVTRSAGCTVEGRFESTVLLIEHPPYQTYADATPVGSLKS